MCIYIFYILLNIINFFFYFILNIYLLKHLNRSPEVVKKVMKTASYNLTPCILELGGKDCAIIRHDTNLNTIIPIIMRGTFQNSGQNCIGIERVLIHESLHD